MLTRISVGLRVLALLLIGAVLGLAAEVGIGADADQRVPACRALFSPPGCSTAIVADILAAHGSIEVQAYTFTSPTLAAALCAARQRGIDVTVVLDARASRAQACQARHLAAAGCSVLLDSAHATAHNKVLLIDDDTVLTGSYNWTDDAENRNAENVLEVRNMPAVASAYSANFKSHVAHSVPWR